MNLPPVLYNWRTCQLVPNPTDPRVRDANEAFARIMEIAAEVFGEEMPPTDGKAA